MTETSSNTAEPSIEKHVFGWLLFIVSLFPLVALLTYDWRSVAALRVPPLPSTNWVGALGDTFAYYGYTVIGLAVWIIPVVCVALGLCLVGGRRLRLGRRIPWFALLLAACACLLLQLGGQVFDVALDVHDLPPPYLGDDSRLSPFVILYVE